MTPAASLCLLASSTILLGHAACFNPRHQRSVESPPRSYLPPPSQLNPKEANALNPSDKKKPAPSTETNIRNVNCSISVVRDECNDVTKPSCETIENEVCRPETKQKCEQIEKEECEDVESKKCDTVLEDVCETVEVEVCVDEEKDDCKTVSSEICKDVTERKCNNYEEDVCEEVTERSCSQVWETECSQVMEESCQQTTEKECTWKKEKVCGHRGKRFALDKLLSPLTNILAAKAGFLGKLMNKKKPAPRERSCKWVHRESCVDKPRQTCQPVLTDVCQEVPRTVCDPTVRNVCQKETRESCQPETRSVCDEVPKVECNTIKVPKCSQVPEQSCTKVEKQVCNPVLEKECKKVNVESCKDITDPNCVIEESETCTDITEKVCEPVTRLEIRLSGGKTCQELQDEEDKRELDCPCAERKTVNDVIDLRELVEDCQCGADQSVMLECPCGEIQTVEGVVDFRDAILEEDGKSKYCKKCDENFGKAVDAEDKSEDEPAVKLPDVVDVKSGDKIRDDSSLFDLRTIDDY